MNSGGDINHRRMLPGLKTSLGVGKQPTALHNAGAFQTMCNVANEALVSAVGLTLDAGTEQRCAIQEIFHFFCKQNIEVEFLQNEIHWH